MDCVHPVRLSGLCAICGKDISQEESFDNDEDLLNERNSNLENHSAILHTNYGLTVSAQEAERVEKTLQRRLLNARKLSLVVDLDQTVLHASIDPAVEGVAKERDDIYKITLNIPYSNTYYIKLRPQLIPFLERMSKLYELHIYTMGSKEYAQAVVKLFDPTSVLFYDRILTRDDSGIIGNVSDGKKSLKRIFPVDDNTVVVIDDRADVWDYCLNLVPVHPYCFFIGAMDMNRHWSEFNSNEKVLAPGGIENSTEGICINDSDNDLITIETILTDVHSEYFELLQQRKQEQEEKDLPDVKELIRKRRNILSGFTIVFSGLIPKGLPPNRFELWLMAEAFGAKCSTSIQKDTSCLISLRPDTDKVMEAIELGINVINPNWIINCCRFWTLQPMENYLLTNLPPPRPKRVIVAEPDETQDEGSSEHSSEDDTIDGQKSKRLRLENNQNSEHISSEDDSLVALIESDLL